MDLQLTSINKYRKYAPIILRIGLSLVFLWFGISQLVNAESFIGYVPDWLAPHAPQMTHKHPLQFMHNVPLAPHIPIMINGFIETIFGLLLFLGIFTRISSLLLSLHLFVIMIGLGYNDIAVRDFGLALATLSVFFSGPDPLCWDKKRKV